MKNKMNIPKFFTREAELLIRYRKECIDIHESDIRAAGNQIEIPVREWLKRMLPKNVSISHGHIIDMNNVISSQIDCILSDNKGIPTLFTSQDGTDYSPMDSIYAIGEIKSTYYKGYIEQFSLNMKDIKTTMQRDLIKNTMYDGLKDDTLLEYMLHSSGNKYLNKLYSFMLFINSGNFKDEDIINIYQNEKDEYLPNIAVFLDKCIVIKATITNNGMEYYKYPEESPSDASWYIIPMPEKDDISAEGKHLGVLFHQLISHIKSSILEVPNLNNYLYDLLIGSKSKIIKI